MSRHFLRDQSGVSAVEFAIVAPVLIMVLLAMADVWSYFAANLGMRAAVKAGANYVILGGHTPSKAEAVAMSAWSSAPEDASVSVAEVCYCSNQVSACAALCSGTEPPSSYFEIAATGTWIPPAPVRHFLESRSMANQKVIRVR